MPRTTARRQGDWAEQRVLRLLQQRGWRMLSHQWACRWGELDLVVEKGGRLLVVEVKGRRRCGPDGWGLASLRRGKRQRLERAWACWLEGNPAWAECSVEMVYALVPLAPAAGAVRWIRPDT